MRLAKIGMVRERIKQATARIARKIAAAPKGDPRVPGWQARLRDYEQGLRELELEAQLAALREEQQQRGTVVSTRTGNAAATGDK